MAVATWMRARHRAPRHTAARKDLRRWLRISVAMLSGLVLTSCAGNSSPNVATTGGTLRVGLSGNQKLDDLNPALGRSIVGTLAYEPLIERAPDGTYRPGLATKWEYIGAGNTTFQLTLRQNARFSDGTPVNSAAVKRWLEYVPQAKGYDSGRLQIASVETPDDWTVKINLSAASGYVAYWLSLRAWAWVPSSTAVSDPASLSQATYGAGPYVLDPSQSVLGAQAVLTYLPNKYFYDKSKIHWNKIVLKQVTSPSSMLQAMQAHQFDVAFGDVSTADAAKAAGLTVTLNEVGWVGVQFYAGGNTGKPLSDVRVRQALNYAIDRKTIVTGLFGQWSHPTSQDVWVDAAPPLLDPKLQDFYGYDVAKAKGLLAAAGYPNGFSVNVLVQQDTGVYGDPLIQAVAKYLNAVGVNINIIETPTQSVKVTKLLAGAAGGSVTAITADAATGQQVYEGLYSPTGALHKFVNPDQTISGYLASLNTLPSTDQPVTVKKMVAYSVEQATQMPVATVPNLVYVSSSVNAPLNTYGAYLLQWTPKS